MAKQRFQYGISGYRQMPESFRAFKGLRGISKEVVPLTRAERSEVANQFLKHGFRAAVAHIKHLERQREHRSKRYVTYGFKAQEQPNLFVRRYIAVRTLQLKSGCVCLSGSEGSWSTITAK